MATPGSALLLLPPPAEAREAGGSVAGGALLLLAPLEVDGRAVATAAEGVGALWTGGGGGGGAADRKGVAPGARRLAEAESGRRPAADEALPVGDPSREPSKPEPPPTVAEAAGLPEPGPRDMGRDEAGAKNVDVDVAEGPSGGGAEGATEKSLGAPASERGTTALPPSKFVRQIMTISSPPAVAKYAPSGVKEPARTPALWPCSV